MDQSSDQCSLCTDAETFENPIVNCNNCGIKVHILCYGIANLDASLDVNWKCSPCQSNESQPVCKLCMQNDGAMKKTTCGGWIHVLCALFTEGCRFVDNNSMEPVDISRVSDSKKNRMCIFCKSDGGFASLCDTSKCKNRLHISCAHKIGCLKEEKDRHDKLKFRAYCVEHKPTSDSRRISSEFVRVVALKKNRDKKKKKEKKAEEKREKQKSSTMNTQWLLDKTSNANEITANKKPESDESSNVLVDALQIDTSLNVNESPSNRKRQTDEPVDKSGSPKQKQPKIVYEQSLIDWDSSKINSLTSSMADIFENKENFHTCYKDECIRKLKEKNKKLKAKLGRLEDLNANLQQQLLCAKQFLQTPSGQADVSNQDVIQALKNRIVPELSEDETEFVFPNGAKILVKLMKQLETIPGKASSDRLYVNTSFLLFFGDKYINKKIKKCKKSDVELPKLREAVLKILRESNRHQIMKDLYEYRIYNDGVGDLIARVRLFKLIFRTKFNNWWNANAIKHI